MKIEVLIFFCYVAVGFCSVRPISLVDVDKTGKIDHNPLTRKARFIDLGGVGGVGGIVGGIGFFGAGVKPGRILE